MNKRKKVIIVAPSILPIPAIQSGAYEQLIESIINLNEELKVYNFLVISRRNNETKTLREKFVLTSFLDFGDNIFLRITNNIAKFIKKITRNKSHYNFYITQIQRIIKRNSYDKILIIGNVDYIKPISEIASKDKIIFYLATEILSHVNLFNNCSRIIVHNQRLVNLIFEKNQMLDSNQVVNLIPGIDIDFFRNSNTTNVLRLRNKLNITSNKKIVCYIGRIVTSKGVNVLLEAALKLKTRDDFVILLIGSLGSNFGLNKNIKVSDIDGIKELIDQLGASCISTGFVENDELADYLALADIGIVPSICEDVAPASYLQFQAIGIPTVVSNGGGIPEFYSPDYSIMVYRGEKMIDDLVNAISLLLDSDESRRSMGELAMIHSDKFSMKRYFNDLVSIIEK